MTNEDKAKRIALDKQSEKSSGFVETYLIAYESAIEMAEWKDRQTREKWHAVLNWLERNAKKYCLSCGAASYDTGMLIYELRKATEGGEEISQKITEKPSLLQRVSGQQIIPNHVFDCIDEKRKDAYINHIVMDMAIEMKKKGLIHIEEEDTVDGVKISAKMFVVSPEAYADNSLIKKEEG